MATDAKSEMTTAELLHFYVGMRLQKGDRKVPIQEILADFPEYMRQRERMRDMIREADQSLESGQSEPLDLEQLIEDVVRELAEEGISE
jgi:hypothetical protein